MKSINGGIKANVSGFNSNFRDPFPAFPGSNWTTVNTGTGDLVGIDGNSVGASYLVISKNPLDTTGNETIVESTATFGLQAELAAAIHLSQRTIGQELTLEVVGAEAVSATPAEVAISSISQATTTLTVNTATPHGYKVGTRIGIYGVSDSRFNYSQLVVATTPTPTQFTCTAGPGGTIFSTTAGPFTSGYVYQRSAMAFSPNGTALVFEGTSATAASFYAKSENDDIMPLAPTALAGQQTTTVATSASTQPVVALANYNFRPSSEYRLALLSDRVQWHDVPIDSVAQSTARATVTQVIPNNKIPYKIRLRGKNHKALTAPVAKVVSAAKTGTTTATVVTDVAHGLTTGDYVNIYGTRDQTNFANLSTGTVVASVVNSTTFTIVWGTAVTATTYGGFVSRVQGGQIQQGVTTQVVQSASLASNILTLVGNATWAGVLIGDYVNVHGVRVDLTGANLGVDGVYRVRDLPTANPTWLVLEPIDDATTTALTTLGTLSSTNCGGSVIKRTDMRVSFIRMFDFNRVRIDTLNRPIGDIAGAMPVQVANVPSVAVSSGTVTTVSTITSANLAIPGTIADIASVALTTTTTTAAITPTYGTEYQVNIPVTAVSGTTPTLDVVIQESDDAGTNWFDVYHFPRITAVGMYRSPKLPLKGNRIRYVQTVAGTTPSFTRAVNRLQGSFNGTGFVRRVFDRAVSLTTLNATTVTAAGSTGILALNTQECNNVQLAINIGAVTTTAPALQLEGSNDGGVNWFPIGAPLTAVASSTVQAVNANINAELVRARVSTAGVGVTSGYVEIHAWQ